MVQKKKQNWDLVLENAILMSADIFSELHKLRGEENVFETAEIIAEEARELERKLSKIEDGEYDYIDELEKHETFVLKKWSID